tara:strand:+ start:1474 stop:1695 length:222 start_codon:yes stop_codon:yes gene_type:complete
MSIEQTLDQVEETIADPTSVEEYYGRLKLLVESMELDALKSNKGNKAAGIRLRKSLRHLKSYSGDFVKFTLQK